MSVAIVSMELIVFIATSISRILENRNSADMFAKSVRMEFVEFLIMENLPIDGRYVDVSELKNNVISDAFSLKKHRNKFIFESVLEDLNEKQYVFINKGNKKVAATQYGINKFS
tara:strand:+ start:45 stop:386 length:342 start_codon:yes stop_codon:yes gene_type:complete